MLIDAYMTKCVIMDRVSTSDGIGGVIYTWVDGAEFMAAITKDNTMEARIAEKEGVTELYTVTVDKDMALQVNDVFKRKEDGAIFRVKSNIVDSKTPNVASFQFGQVNAERLEALR